MQVTRDELYNAIDQRELVQLTNDNPSGNSIDETKIDEALVFANGFIDDALRANYTLPLPEMPVLKDIGVDLALYKIFQLRHRAKMPEGISESYKNACALLREYSTGTKQLDITAVPTESVSLIRTGTRARSFTEDILKKY